jgi:Ni/Co efflux regulator RcnB
MKKLLIPAFALALAAGAPTLVWSQDDHDKDKTHAAAGQGDGAKPETTHQDKTPKADNKTPKTDNHTAGPDAMSGAEKNKSERDRTRDLNRGGAKTDTQTDTKSDRGDNRDNDRSKNDNHNDRTTNHTNVRVNINLSTYRKAVTASRHFRAGAYRAPQHYSYRRYNIGERLDAEYYARDYWLTDFAAYDLVAPPDGYVWVRFGPDALLIDEDTGEVLQVEYGVFI